MSSVTAYRDCAEAAWRWVLTQVRWDDAGPWVPAAATEPPAAAADWDRNGIHSGIGGLALTLGEIRRTRPWTDEEQALADGIAAGLRAAVPAETNCSYFDGLAGYVEVLAALDADGTEQVVDRLLELAADDGWPQSVVAPPAYADGSRLSDVTLGTGAVLLAAVWAHRRDVPGASDLAAHATDVLMAEAEPVPAGLNWRFVPARFRADGSQMPNWSHGLAGIAGALAVAGIELGRPDLVDAARLGAEHLVTLGRHERGGFVVPRTIPHEDRHGDEITHGWCHGGTGTSSLFLALDRAGVDRVAGEGTLAWHRACLEGVRHSGLPERLHPGFWDNDGRCCGTAGVAEVFLDSWVRAGDEQDLEFALHLADVLLERAVVDPTGVRWRFVEHTASDPLLPPGVGWMQGAAGIASFLFRLAHALETAGAHQVTPGSPVGAAVGPVAGVRPPRPADADVAARMDNWWTLPPRR